MIQIDNSECKIEGLSVLQHKSLSAVLSYVVNPTAHFFAGGYGPKRQSLLSKRGTFPAGVLYLVKAWCAQNKLTPDVKDLRIIPLSKPNLFNANIAFSPYPDQLEAAEAAVKNHRGIIVAPTGVGKSLIVALIIQKVAVPTLIVVPNLELKRQLAAFLSEVFGQDKVGKNKPIYVENIDSAPQKFTAVNYDCVIIDEFHHSGAKTYRQLNKKAWNTVYYKFGVTATPFRSQDHEKLLLESVLSNTIYKISYSKAIENGYIVPMEAYYIEVPKTQINSNRWHEVYTKLVVQNKKRNALISALLTTLKNEDKNVLCLVKETLHGEILSKESLIMFAHGQDKDSADMIKFFSQDRLKCLIGTTGILGEGVDTKPAEFIIIAGLGKSRNQFMQQVGRGFRRFKDKFSCKIILIKDDSHKWTKEHFKAQCKILKEEYGILPLKLDTDAL